MSAVLKFARTPMKDSDLMTANFQKNAAKPVRIAQLDRKSTAQECVRDFFKSCVQIQRNNDDNYHAVMTMGVGLKIENKNSLFDLVHFIHKPNVFYAIDQADRQVYETKISK